MFNGVIRCDFSLKLNGVHQSDSVLNQSFELELGGVRVGLLSILNVYSQN